MSTPNPATTPWVPLWNLNGASGMQYRGAYAAATQYADGDIVVYNGVAYMCVRPTQNPPAVWPMAPGTSAYGTTLPASPYDGQEAVLVDSVTNPSYQWRFRYNAQSTSAYKWEFVGGSRLVIFPANYTPPATGAYYTDAAAGATITVPRAGYYVAEAYTQVGAAVNSGQYMGFSPSDRMGTWVTSTSEGFVFLQRFYTYTAGQQVQNAFYCSSALSVFGSRTMSILPVRVS
ncbi:MAG TPA: carbohydrate-binding protein [Gaiellaceae bacterium]|jgi:hypothetical protein